MPLAGGLINPFYVLQRPQRPIREVDGDIRITVGRIHSDLRPVGEFDDEIE
jgi:hypothetical protein